MTQHKTASDIIKESCALRWMIEKNTFKNSWPDQQEKQDAKKCIEKSITTVCIEEGISFEQIFYILYVLFLLLYLS